jgi:HlyD family secretion protein
MAATRIRKRRGIGDETRSCRIEPPAQRATIAFSMLRILAIVLVLALAALGMFALLRGNSEPTVPEIAAERGTVVRKAVAVGVVEPEHETQVISRLAGVARKVHARLGQKVKAGDALVEVWPVLSDEDLLRAERSLQAAKEGREAASEFVQGEHVLAYLSRFLQGERNLERMQRSADRGLRSAEEAMTLLREGRVEIGGRVIDFVVRAPVDGHVLTLLREGDPVTPASSFGAGTIVAVLGDLDRSVFRGTVDEIDVGRLRGGMPARVTLGALPDAELTGKVTEIGLRARQRDNAAVFDVRIALEPRADLQMRAGFSAVAEIELASAQGVVIPERAVAFEGRAARVLVRGADGEAVERAVELGIGDGLRVHVVSGLQAGERVLDRSTGAR